MKKKITIYTLLSLLSLGTIAGCNNGNTNKNYDFTIWCYQTDSTIKNYENSPVFKELEKRTGKKVKFILDGDQSSLISTKSYPEVCLWLSYPNGYETGIRNNIVKDITDIVKNDMPNYKKIITSNDEIWRVATCGDNQIGALYVINKEIEPPWRGLVMRKDAIVKYKDRFTTYTDWEDLGEKDSNGNTILTPTLYSHYTDIFNVMRNVYNETGGKEGFKYPLSMAAKGFDGHDVISAGFDVALGDTGYYDCNGTLKTGYVEDGFKDYLTQMNAWYKQGFINPNFAQSSNALTTDNSDTVGTARAKPYSMCWPEISTYMDLKIKLGKENGISDYDLMPVPNPRQTKDKINHLVNTNGFTGMSACITTKCDDAKAKEICEWFDYLYSDEAYDLMNYGVEGETCKKNEDGTYSYLDCMYENPDKAFYEKIAYNVPAVYDVHRRDCFLSENVKRAVNEVWSYKNDGSYNLKNTATFTGSSGTEYAAIMNACQTYVIENTIKFIKGTKSISREFDTYRNELVTKYNINRATELREESYRDYLKHSVPEDWK